MLKRKDKEMNRFVIENNVLKAYLGTDKIVIVPDGVKMIGGHIEENEENDPNFPEELKGDPIGYKAFYRNDTVEELYLPDSVETIGYKSLEHCKTLKVLAFSGNMKTVEWNGLYGCENLKKIIYRGPVYDFTCLVLAGHLDLDAVYCTDGVIKLHQEFYIDELHYPGTREEWENDPKNEWKRRRCKKVICKDEERKDNPIDALKKENI